MFLRSYQRTKQGKTHTYYALVESVRTDAGPRQRVVAHLGELNHDQERRWRGSFLPRRLDKSMALVGSSQMKKPGPNANARARTTATLRARVSP